MKDYKNDPVAFVTDMVGEVKIQPHQSEMLRILADPDIRFIALSHDRKRKQFDIV